MRATKRMRRGASLLALAALAACDDTTGPGGDRLQPEDVAGVYLVCQLRFVPEGAQPEVDIVAAGINPGAAQLALDVEPQSFELEFTPRGQFTDRELRGSYDLREGEVTLRPSTTGVNRESLLLPDRIPLAFQASPRRLTLQSSQPYDVPRADYARLAGIPETGLATRIPGRLSARFGFPGCS